MSKEFASYNLSAIRTAADHKMATFIMTHSETNIKPSTTCGHKMTDRCMMPASNYLREPGRDMWYQYQIIWWTQNLVLHPGTLVRPTFYIELNHIHFVVLVVKSITSCHILSESCDHTLFLKRTHNTFFLFRPATRSVQTDMRRRSTCPAGILNAFHCEIHRTLAPNSQTLQNLN